MIQSETEYLESQERAVIEEYAKEKEEDNTEAGVMMRETANGI